MNRHVEGITIYAVDFDGTLCEHSFPGFGAPNTRLIQWLIEKRKAGDKVILWTNRMGVNLDNAVAWCHEQGLDFDAVNDNIPEVMERYKHVLNGAPASRKITADVFIDDAACSVGLPFGSEGCVLEECWEKTCKWRVAPQPYTDMSDDLAKQILELRNKYGEEAFNQAMYELGWNNGD